MSYNTEADTIYKLKVVIPKWKPRILYPPDGLFTNFQGMQPREPLITNWILNSIKTNQTN
jgi:hypothetical protein